MHSAFMKAFSNSIKLGMGDKENDGEEKEFEKEARAYVYSSNFFNFCDDDVCMYYFYCCATRYRLLKSSLVATP